MAVNATTTAEKTNLTAGARYTFEGKTFIVRSATGPYVFSLSGKRHELSQCQIAG
jgi:hypothetical protein